MNEKQIVFDSVVFDKEDKTFTILDGTIGTYSLEEVVKCTILGESSKFRGKTEPFAHTVITGVGVATAPLFEPGFYVGIKVTMKNGDILAIYISKKEVRMNTDGYFHDYEIAQKIKKAIDLKGDVKLSTKEKNIQQVKKSGNKFKVLHKDMVQFWKGRSIFMILAIIGGILVSLYKIDLKKMFPYLGGKERFDTIVENAVYKLDELASFDIHDHERNTIVHIENNAKNKDYIAEICDGTKCDVYEYKENKVFVTSNGNRKEILPERIINEEQRFFEITNLDQFVGKTNYLYDMFGELDEKFTEGLPRKDERGNYHSWTHAKEGLRRFTEDYTLTKESSTSIYTRENRLYIDNETETQLDDYAPYTLTIHINEDGYITLAKLDFEDEGFEDREFDYTFTNLMER